MWNGLFLNLTKTKIMKFLSDYQNNALFQIFSYEDNLIQEEINTEFLGLEVDKHLNLKTHI
jgi:hypothetical protein